MPLKYAARKAVSDHGERFALVVELPTGIPHFRTTVFSTTMRRSKGLAANTLLRDSRCLARTLTWADRAEIDLVDRFEAGNFLTVNEIDAFVASTKRRSVDLLAVETSSGSGPRRTAGREHFRVASPKPKGALKSGTSGFQIWISTKYFKWLADTTAQVLRPGSEAFCERQLKLDSMLQQLQERTPDPDRAPTESRLGLTEKDQELLIKVINPNSQLNPWKSSFIRHRNHILISLLLDEGFRRGEVLKQKTSNIDFEKNEITVTRSPDDPRDPRKSEPNVKRVGRTVPMSDSLASEVRDFIVSYWSQTPGVRRHGYLFTTGAGTPLSISSVQKIFATLRKHGPKLPSDLCAHLLRHTWNDNYSDFMDKEAVPPATEERNRNYLMGWKPGSGTAARYTKRHVERAAKEASLRQQNSRRKKSDAQG